MNKSALLALNRIPGIGSRSVLKLLQHYPHLNDVFHLKPALLEALGFSSSLAQAIIAFDHRQIEHDLAWEQKDNHHIITWDDSLYPAQLKEIYAPPFILYAKGNIQCLQGTHLAIVGTRKPSASGGDTAWQFAYDLAEQNLCIISGLALGIDAHAHKGCLAAHGKTIAVMGTGMHTIYPFQHRDLAQKISEEGLLLSEFPLHNKANAGHFPQRNRIISGLSMATLVVEAAIKSGSLITARFALEQNREVLAIPGSIHNPQARGCHYLLQQGATLVTKSQDVLEALGINRLTIPAAHKLALASEPTNLVKCVGFEVTSVDEILRRSALNYSTVICGLAELELKGLIKNVPGGYSRCVLIEGNK